MKSGYILLEIIIAIALGAFISSALLTTFFQVSNAYKKTDQIISIDTRVCTISHQLERDISGAFIPFKWEKQSETKTTTTTTTTKKGKTDVKKTVKKEKEKKGMGNGKWEMAKIRLNPLKS
ncbi:hypothetical protein KAH94_05325, partial [bacterium]|nr:hypothetical protein [bacterium]